MFMSTSCDPEVASRHLPEAHDPTLARIMVRRVTLALWCPIPKRLEVLVNKGTQVTITEYLGRFKIGGKIVYAVNAVAK